MGNFSKLVSFLMHLSGAARISVGGNTLGVSVIEGPGGEPPDPGEFSKIFKKFLKKIAKNALF